MIIEDFDYALPPELIAQEPAPTRTGSRLFVIDRKTGGISHRMFPDLLEYLRPGDLLVFNDTRVIPARMFGVKEGTGGKVEVLLIVNVEGNTWEALVKPGDRVKPGHILLFGGGRMKGRVLERTTDGTRIIEFDSQDFMKDLQELGEVPLPPYIKKKAADPGRYQTVFAKEPGSSAGPTAAFHFDNEIIDKIRALGVESAYVTLHIGPGTFRPVKTLQIEDHRMHREFFSIPQETIEAVQKARKEGRRIIPIGTTSTRTLETVFDEEGNVRRTTGWTDIFIYPGYKFKMADALVTNFHLPRSTLLMLVSALAGRDLIMKAYDEAVKERYRFFSFGDCMLIV
jgi:S-adenosylmethionine:tRNA ribosyltransferase-isomerase